MSEGVTGRRGHFEDGRMWRRLLARLHPDVGGDPELFLFVRALKDEVCGEPRFQAGRTAREEPDTRRFLTMWRGAMDSWASHNRDALKKHRTKRGTRRR